MKDLGIDKLPAEQRIALLREICASLDDEVVPHIVDASKGN